jgi:putative tryptophan/tyrosine transport system substrate-binding protein
LKGSFGGESRFLALPNCSFEPLRCCFLSLEAGMRRREFIGLVGGVVASWPLATRAQQAEHIRRIGVLMALEENEPEGKAQLLGFTRGLSELGWAVGPNLQIEIRWGGGDINRIRTLAKELVAMRPDVILAQGTPVTAALHRETRTFR